MGTCGVLEAARRPCGRFMLNRWTGDFHTAVTPRTDSQELSRSVPFPRTATGFTTWAAMSGTGAATSIEPMPLPSAPRAVRSAAIPSALKPRRAKRSFQATLRRPQFLEWNAVSPRADRFSAIRITVKDIAPRRGVARRQILEAAMLASAARKMRHL
jgi:hypothetical protein